MTIEIVAHGFRIFVLQQAETWNIQGPALMVCQQRVRGAIVDKAFWQMGKGVTRGRKIDSLRPNGWRSKWLVLIKIVLQHRVGGPIQYRHQTWPCDGIENNCIESTDNWMGGRA